MDICFLDIVVLGNCESFGCRTCRNEMEGVIRAVQDKVVIDELLALQLARRVVGCPFVDGSFAVKNVELFFCDGYGSSIYGGEL